MAAKRYLDVRYDVTDLSDEEVDQLALEAGAQAERSDGHPTVEVEIKTNDVDDEADGGASLTPEPREAVERLLDIPADDEQTPPFGRVPLRNFVANVLGEDLIDHDMPVESKPDPVRPSDEGLLILYGDKRDGVTVGRAEGDGQGSVEIWGEGAIRSYVVRQLPVPTLLPPPAEGPSARDGGGSDPSHRPAESDPPTPERSEMAEQETATKPRSRKPAAKAEKKKAAAPNDAQAEQGTDLMKALMGVVRETVEGKVEEAPNKSGTYTRLQIAGKTFAYIFPPRAKGLAVKIPKQLLDVEASLPKGHGFHRTTWGLTRTITKPSETASVARAFAVAATAAAPKAAEEEGGGAS